MSEKNSQRSSDPLPYVQVDRAVKTKAASLASVLGVSNQHAMGTLVEFWELCGDPRELEKLLGAGNTEVVFNRDEIVARFKIASGGKLIDPSDLVTLGLLEQRDDGSFRVRGMSRYFAPIEKRLRARACASAGGKARASGAHRQAGQFVPVRIVGADADGSSAAGVLLVADQPIGSHPPAERQPTDQPTTSRNASTADSGQRSVDDVQAQAAPTARRPSMQENFFVWAQTEAARIVPQREAEGTPKSKVLNAQLAQPLKRVGRSGLEQAWKKFLDDAGARTRGWPWGLFVAQWERHYNAATTSPTPSASNTKLVGADLTRILAKERARQSPLSLGVEEEP